MSADKSPSFTVEDIHRVREEMYEETRGLGIEGINAYLHAGAKEAQAEIEKRRGARAAEQPPAAPPLPPAFA